MTEQEQYLTTLERSNVELLGMVKELSAKTRLYTLQWDQSLEELKKWYNQQLKEIKRSCGKEIDEMREQYEDVFSLQQEQIIDLTNRLNERGE